MSYEQWRVVATQPGAFDQIYRETGEVFELLPNDDGTFPLREDWVPKRDSAGQEIPDEGTWVLFKDANGEPVHRDFAEDMGDQLMKAGPMRGEVMRFGWMKRVPDHTPCGLYPPGTDFWPGEQRAKARATAPKSTAQTAPIKGSTQRPRHERVP